MSLQVDIHSEPLKTCHFFERSTGMSPAERPMIYHCSTQPTWDTVCRVPGLSCDVVCVILRLAVSAEHRLVTDGQTDRHTTTANTRAS